MPFILVSVSSSLQFFMIFYFKPNLYSSRHVPFSICLHSLVMPPFHPLTYPSSEFCIFHTPSLQLSLPASPPHSTCLFRPTSPSHKAYLPRPALHPSNILPIRLILKLSLVISFSLVLLFSLILLFPLISPFLVLPVPPSLSRHAPSYLTIS